MLGAAFCHIRRRSSELLRGAQRLSPPQGKQQFDNGYDQNSQCLPIV